MLAFKAPSLFIYKKALYLKYFTWSSNFEIIRRGLWNRRIGLLFNFNALKLCLSYGLFTRELFKTWLYKLQYEDYIDILHLKSCSSQVGTCEPSSFHSKPKLKHHIPPRTTAPKPLPATYQISYIFLK